MGTSSHASRVASLKPPDAGVPRRSRSDSGPDRHCTARFASCSSLEVQPVPPVRGSPSPRWSGSATTRAWHAGRDEPPARAGGTLALRVDFAALREMLADYYAADLWDALEAPGGDVEVVVAERSLAASAADRGRRATARPRPPGGRRALTAHRGAGRGGRSARVAFAMTRRSRQAQDTIETMAFQSLRVADSESRTASLRGPRPSRSLSPVILAETSTPWSGILPST